MRRRTTFMLAVAIVAVAVFYVIRNAGSGPSSSASPVSDDNGSTQTGERSFACRLANDGTLNIEATGVDVRVSASDSGSEVMMESFLAGQAADPDKFVVSARQIDSATVVVRATPTAAWSSDETGGGRIIVTLPARANISIVGGRGSVMVREVRGSKSITVGDGDVAIAGGAGVLNARLRRGSLSAERYAGPCAIEVRGGSVSLAFVDGAVRVRNDAGIRAVAHLGSLDLDGGSGPVDVEILRIDSTSTIRTTTGDIHLRLPASTAAHLSISGRPDGILVPPSFGLATVADDGVIEGDVHGGGMPMRVESRSGRIRVDE